MIFPLHRLYTLFDDSGVVPTFPANFMSGAIPASMTFTRASIAYYFNSSSNLTQAAVNQARFDCNPATGALRGILLEPSSTNSITNNTMQGAVVGVIGGGGSAPTDWLIGTAVGVTSREVVSIGSENGIDYIDIRYQGNGTNAFGINVAVTPITAAQNQRWNYSCFVTLVGGSLAGLDATSPYLQIIEFPGLPNSIATMSPITGNLNVNRYRLNRVLTGGATTGISCYIGCVPTGAFDFTLRIGLPQCEQYSVPTSPIKTSAGAVTRAEDSLSVTASNAGYQTLQGTLYGCYSYPYTGIANDPPAVAADDGSFNNLSEIYYNSGGANLATRITRATGVLQYGNGSGVIPTANQICKAALAYQAGNIRSCYNGALGASGAGNVSLNVSNIWLGKRAGGGGGPVHMREFQYYNSRLSDASLQTLTT